MPLKVPDIGLLTLIDAQRTAWGGTLTVGLFENNYMPVAGTLLANLTEPTWPGYAQQTIASWGAAGMVGGRAKTIASSVSFTLSTTGGPYAVYGYFVLSGGNLLWAERDPAAPIVMATTGDMYGVLATFTGVSEF